MKRLMIRNVTLVALGIFFLSAAPVAAQVTLGTAQSFGVLAGQEVTNLGPSTINANVGTFPGTSITGFPPGIVVGGSIHSGDAVAGQAQSDLTAAYNAAAGTACSTDLTGQDLGGLVLTPGVYCFSSTAFLTGTLTLNMQGNPNALFIFKIGTGLTTASGSSVLLINSGSTTCPPNVFWQVGSSAVLGTGSTFAGNILALTSITLPAGANLNGRALARNGTVTMNTNTVTVCGGALACPGLTLNPSTLPGGTVALPYNATVTASGSAGPFTYSVTSGSLPTGLTLNTGTGVISGVPAFAGNSGFTITAASAGCLVSRFYTIAVTVGAAAGGSTLDMVGLMILTVLLAGAGLFAMNRMSL